MRGLLSPYLHCPFHSMEEDGYRTFLPTRSYFEFCALFFEKKGFRDHRTEINPSKNLFFNISSREKDRNARQQITDVFCFKGGTGD